MCTFEPSVTTKQTTTLNSEWDNIQFSEHLFMSIMDNHDILTALDQYQDNKEFEKRMELDIGENICNYEYFNDNCIRNEEEPTQLTYHSVESDVVESDLNTVGETPDVLNCIHVSNSVYLANLDYIISCVDTFDADITHGLIMSAIRSEC